MFTGLIEEVGKVKSITGNNLNIYCSKILSDSKTGDSIAVNGLCLTITEIFSNYISFHISKTTKQHSIFNIGQINTGHSVNLERALRLTDRLGGHLVSGHVDGKVEIISIDKKGTDTFLEFLFPKKLKPFIVEKGSVALDGISLTVSELLTASFAVTVIPHTIKNTNLNIKRINDYMHIEVDILGRHIFHLLKTGGIYEGNKKIIERFSAW